MALAYFHHLCVRDTAMDSHHASLELKKWRAFAHARQERMAALPPAEALAHDQALVRHAKNTAGVAESGGEEVTPSADSITETYYVMSESDSESGEDNVALEDGLETPAGYDSAGNPFFSSFASPSMSSRDGGPHKRTVLVTTHRIYIDGHKEGDTLPHVEDRRYTVLIRDGSGVDQRARVAKELNGQVKTSGEIWINKAVLLDAYSYQKRGGVEVMLLERVRSADSGNCSNPAAVVPGNVPRPVLTALSSNPQITVLGGAGASNKVDTPDVVRVRQITAADVPLDTISDEDDEGDEYNETEADPRLVVGVGLPPAPPLHAEWSEQTI